MRRIFYLFSLIFLLNGCAESMALLGGATNGKITQSALNTAVSYGVKKQTGKTPLEHALNHTEKKEVKKVVLNNKIQPCVEFLEPVSENICTVIKNNIQKLSKVKNLN